ncbi:MAG: hypothetical protein AB8H80_03905 [Planctomycetota bacterium]
MKTSMLFLSLPIAAALAFAPQQDPAPAQDPQAAANAKADPPAEVVAITPMSELQFTNLQGTTTVVSARTVVEIRVWDDASQYVQIELTYENGDYSRITAQAIHILRNGPTTRDVRLVRCHREGMRFPRLP